MSLKVFGNLTELRNVARTINGDIHKSSILMLVDLIEKHIVGDCDYVELPERLKLGAQINYIENEHSCKDGEEEAILEDILIKLRNEVEV